jgi:hypothetical protein
MGAYVFITVHRELESHANTSSYGSYTQNAKDAVQLYTARSVLNH